MIGFFKNKKVNEFSMQHIESECIPYACHYDEFSLLTKNGELIQVIRVEGLAEELTKLHDKDLRSIIRKAVLDNIKDRTISVYFHTIRNKHNLDSVNYFSWTFARDNHDGWAKKNYWRDKYVNELYITIIHEGENFNKNEYIASSIFPKLLKKKYLSKLELNAKNLHNVAIKMQEILKSFGGKRLSIVYDHLGAHSELLQFLSKITCLRDKRMPMPICGLDKIFGQTKIAFGGNTLEVVDNNEKHFAAILTIKEYHEFSTSVLDKFLRISSEFVITQALNFVDSETAKKEFNYLNYILNVSKDSSLRNYSGLASTIDNDKGNPTDYALQQISVMIIGETQEALENSVKTAMKELRKLGIVVIREDLNIELSFWAQLPGNFAFFRRQSYINTFCIAGFASLHNTPSGDKENIWGSSLSIFRKENGAPHFFNLHVKDNGHTLIAGSTDSARSLLTNFLLSEASKYEPNILYLDQFENSRVTVKALGGRHEVLNAENSSFAFNPFSLEDTEHNKIFIKNWLFVLLFNGTSNKKFEKKISSAVDKLYTQNDRCFSDLLAIITDEELKEKIKPWCRGGKYGSLFDNKYDELDSGIKINGFDISNILSFDSNLQITTSIILYCIHKFVESIDSTPSILIINDANVLLQNEIFTLLLEFYLNVLKDKNSIAILVCNVDNKVEKNISNINSLFATKIFFPDPEAHRYQKELNLSQETVEKIKHMKLIYRHLMIKQGEEEIIAELNLDGIDYAIKALSGKQDAIRAMDKAIKEAGDNPNRWIIPFYKHLFPESHK